MIRKQGLEKTIEQIQELAKANSNTDKASEVAEKAWAVILKESKELCAIQEAFKKGEKQCEGQE